MEFIAQRQGELQTSPNNGITGDARRSSVELGKKYMDLKIEYAVKQIRELVGGS